MQGHSGRTPSALVIGAVALLGAICLLLVAAPGTEGVVLLVGGVVTVILYAAGYLLQRRLHW
jgi:4-hydroxybenzoate polyprenyltransferase